LAANALQGVARDDILLSAKKSSADQGR